MFFAAAFVTQLRIDGSFFRVADWKAFSCRRLLKSSTMKTIQCFVIVSLLIIVQAEWIVPSQNHALTCLKDDIPDRTEAFADALVSLLGKLSTRNAPLINIERENWVPDQQEFILIR